MCSKPKRPKNLFLGIPYFSNEDSFPAVMKTILTDCSPPFTKEETSNDLLMKHILKEDFENSVGDSDKEGTDLENATSRI